VSVNIVSQWVIAFVHDNREHLNGRAEISEIYIIEWSLNDLAAGPLESCIGHLLRKLSYHFQVKIQALETILARNLENCCQLVWWTDVKKSVQHYILMYLRKPVQHKAKRGTAGGKQEGEREY
jgi:hypothetical protein